MVAGDRVHLSQVLINLVQNGIDASCEIEHSPKRVTVAVGRGCAAEGEPANGDGDEGGCQPGDGERARGARGGDVANREARAHRAPRRGLAGCRDGPGGERDEDGR